MKSQNLLEGQTEHNSDLEVDRKGLKDRETGSKEADSAKIFKGGVFVFIILISQRVVSIAFYSFPQLLEEPLAEYFDLSALGVLSLYSISSFSGIIFLFLMEKIQRKLGNRLLLVLLQFCMLAGGASCYLGVSYKVIELVWLGRVLHGFNFEGLFLILNLMYQKWLNPSVIPIAFLASRVVNRLVLALCTYLIPTFVILEDQGVGEVSAGAEDEPLGLMRLDGLVSCFEVYLYLSVASFLVGLAYYFLDSKKEQNVNPELKEQGVELQEVPDDKKKPKKQQKEEKEEKKSKKKKKKKKAKKKKKKKIKLPRFGFRHLKHLPTICWFANLCVVFHLLSYWQTLFFLTDLVSKRFNLSYNQSKNITTLVPLCTLLAIPLTSYITKRFGHKSRIMLLGAILYVTAFSTLSALPSNPSFLTITVPVVIFSLASSLSVSSAMPILMQTLPIQSIHTVLHGQVMVTNSALVFSPIIFGLITKQRDGPSYQLGLYCLIFMALVYLICASLVIYADSQSAGVLNLRHGHEELGRAKVEAKRVIDLALRAEVEKQEAEELLHDRTDSYELFEAKEMN